MLSQALKKSFTAAQAVLLTVFLVATSTVVQNSDLLSGIVWSQEAVEQCTLPSSWWVVFPFAFVTGGIMNLDGFGTSIALAL
mmetsp:Transcript_69919/g.167835  ORF Transcript_69919/g.167835 Transcript_69919/m.167835 type:complete len:82 (-) Transcript_69919:357-602(-)